MIDFTKWVLPGHYWEKLSINSLLEWEHTYKEITGEFISSVAKFKTITFKCQKPKFSSNPNDREIRIEFSFSQVLFNGFNHLDPDLSQIMEVIQFLQREFGINPADAQCIFIEAGCTIEPPDQYKTIESRLIAFDGNAFDKIYKNGQAVIGKMSFKTETGIKIYGKHLKYQELNLRELLRCENKTFKMRYLKTPEPITLANLTNESILKELKNRLLENLSKVIYNENLDTSKFTKPQKRLYNSWMNPNYIESLKMVRPETYKKERTNLKRLIPKNGIWSEIISRVSSKWDSLEKGNDRKSIPVFTLKPNLSSNQILPDFTYIVGDNIEFKPRTCKITGIDISAQKQGSAFLRESTIKEIYNYDKFLYQELFTKYGPRQGKDLTLPKEFYLIAKNIRNQDSNPRLAARNRVQTYMNSLFPFEPSLALYAKD